MPVHNGEAFVAKSIESILRQTFTDFELLVVDDGSTDGTVSIVKRFVATDSRVNLFQRNRQGLSGVLNFGIAKAKADLIARMDADDIAKPYRLQVQVAEMNGKSRYAVVGGAIEKFSEHSSERRRIVFPCKPLVVRNLMRRRCVVAHPTVMFRRSVVMGLGGYREVFRRAQDYDLWLRLLDEGFLISNLNRTLLEHRGHVHSASTEFGKDQFLSAACARLSHQARVFGLSDPLNQVRSIRPSVYDLFERFLPIDSNMERYRLQHRNLSQYDRQRVNSVYQSVARTTIHRKRGQSASEFLFSVGIAFLRSGDVPRGARAFSTALWRCSLDSVRVIGGVLGNHTLQLIDRLLRG